jgi:hypothetical protein
VGVGCVLGLDHIVNCKRLSFFFSPYLVVCCLSDSFGLSVLYLLCLCLWVKPSLLFLLFSFLILLYPVFDSLRLAEKPNNQIMVETPPSPPPSSVLLYGLWKHNAMKTNRRIGMKPKCNNHNAMQVPMTPDIKQKIPLCFFSFRVLPVPAFADKSKNQI